MVSRRPFALRIDAKLYEALQRWASDEFRSLNGQIEYLLHQALKQSGRLPPDDEADSQARPERG